MLAAATRQDLQGVVDYAKNTILDRVASKTQLQALAEQLRLSILHNLHELHAENQQVIRQGQAQRDQMMVRINTMDQDMKALQQLLTRMLEQQIRMQGFIQKLYQ